MIVKVKEKELALDTTISMKIRLFLICNQLKFKGVKKDTYRLRKEQNRTDATVTNAAHAILNQDTRMVHCQTRTELQAKSKFH